GAGARALQPPIRACRARQPSSFFVPLWGRRYENAQGLTRATNARRSPFPTAAVPSCVGYQSEATLTVTFWPHNPKLAEYGEGRITTLCGRHRCGAGSP